MSATRPVRESKSHVISVRLQPLQVERLQRFARQLGRTASEAAAILIEEGMRRSEFAYIDFRSSTVGRMAYIQASSLAVWEVVLIARAYKMDAQRVAEHLDWPVYRVQAALNYAAAFPDEINNRLDDNESYDFQRLSRALPQTELFVMDENAAPYATKGTTRKGRSGKSRDTRNPNNKGA